MDPDIILFLALTAFATAIAGATAFVIFWPLALVHIRDRRPEVTAILGEGAFLKPRALLWLLRAEYRGSPDRNMTGLTTPARISLLVILFGLGSGGMLWLLAGLLK